MSGSNHSFSLRDLFPPTASTSGARDTLESSTLALIGNLPSSSLLHFALNHLGRQDAIQSIAEPQLSDKARGKQRAVDDSDPRDVERSEFAAKQQAGSTLQNDTDLRHVLVLTPNLATLRRSLVAENDFTLFGQATDADRIALLQRITFKNLPTSAQLTYFLASRYDPENPLAPELYSTYASDLPSRAEDPSFLPSKPTLVILHSPSTYLAETVHEDSGIEGYASMLALFVSTFAHASKSAPQVVLLDPAASTISLPIIPRHLAAQSRKRQRADPDDDNDAAEVERLALVTAIERFFRCVAQVFPVPLSPTHLDFGHLERWRIDARTRTNPSCSFLEFTTQRVGGDDDDDDGGGIDEAGATRILVEG
ncbi:hypothetical protein JCM11491_001495 [Sporobolomyces phaffii]